MASSAPQNVQVVCRFRPQNAREQAEGGKGCCHFVGGETVRVETRTQPLEFTFDHIFQPQAPQEEVFDFTGRQTVDAFFEGYNATIFAYGQTGSGKTHTMMGPSSEKLRGFCDDPEEQGLIPRIAEAIFDCVAEASGDMIFQITCTYVEIYLEKMRDLLYPGGSSQLTIHEEQDGSMYIQGARIEPVGCVEDMMDLMREGAANRVVASTMMNQGSSRSHSIFIIKLVQTNMETQEKKTSKLHLVDLAGSEKVGKTEAEGQQLEEAKNINKSLSTLGLVINHLTKSRRPGEKVHVPYRDSKLTRLLQDSLGGNSRTTLIICCSTSSWNADETVSTLRFGDRAKQIKNKPRVNKEMSVAQLTQLLRQAEAEIAKRDDIIRRLRSGQSVDLSSVEVDMENASTTHEMMELTARVEELEDKLRSSEERNESLRESFSDFEAQEALIQALKEELRAKKEELAESDREQDRLRFQVSEHLALIENLTIGNTKLQTDVENVRELLATVKAELNKQEAKQLDEKDYELSISQLQLQIANLQEELTSASEKENQLKTSMEVYQSRVAEQDATIQSMMDAGATPVQKLIVGDLEEKEGCPELDALMKEAEVDVSALADLVKAKDRDIKRLQRLLGASEEDGSSGRGGALMGADAVVLADVRAQNADLQKQITQAQERIFKLSSDLTHSNASQSEALKRCNRLEREKDALLKDLQNRCEKVVDLQLELDEQREKNEASSKGSGSKRKQDMRIKYLEDKLEKTLNFHDQVVNERSSLRMELQLAEKKLSIRNDRIAHLEKVLQDTQKQYRAQIEQQNETIKVLQDKNAVYEDQVKHFKNERRAASFQPLHGGGGAGSGKRSKVIAGGSRTTVTGGGSRRRRDSGGEGSGVRGGGAESPTESSPDHDGVGEGSSLSSFPGSDGLRRLDPPLDPSASIVEQQHQISSDSLGSLERPPRSSSTSGRSRRTSLMQAVSQGGASSSSKSNPDWMKRLISSLKKDGSSGGRTSPSGSKIRSPSPVPGSSGLLEASPPENRAHSTSAQDLQPLNDPAFEVAQGWRSSSASNLSGSESSKEQ